MLSGLRARGLSAGRRCGLGHAAGWLIADGTNARHTLRGHHLRCMVTQHFAIVAGDDGSHAWGTAVAQFDSVSVKDLVVSVVGWEVLAHKSKELLTNVGGYPGIEWRVKPDDVALPYSCCTLLLRKLEVMVIAATL